MNIKYLADKCTRRNNSLFLAINKKNEMGKYFILDFACDTIETGPEFPQIQEMKKGYDFNAKNSIYELGTYINELPSFEPSLDYFVLHGKARPTDLLSNSMVNGTGFLISKNIKDILLQCILPIHMFYPAVLYHKGEKLKDYYWFQCVNETLECVDFSKSVFFIYKNFSEDIGNIKISSQEDFVKKSKDLQEEDPSLFVWAKKISFNNSFDRNLDLFKVPKFNSNFFISEKLSQLLLQKQATGLDIKSTNLID
ncbi:hypothetical protein QQ008_27875 [Fulvivirgaceae bacterium BMA10]|uniref:Immunity MXAN-0049 protein domain-containing protein n=1 Tax=Splendidivirga corallicola TaxID=3051826 RepID=A0ABT8KWS5_9BACT|nr:hypothetical protein [Fulvivirgaceae bacterium BMA10]